MSYYLDTIVVPQKAGVKKNVPEINESVAILSSSIATIFDVYFR